MTDLRTDGHRVLIEMRAHLKMPPMSTMNKLLLERSDESLKNEGLVLTEQEGNLIARRILSRLVLG